MWFGEKICSFATPVSQKRRRQPISFILDLLSVQMNVPDTKFSRNTMKLLNHNASTLLGKLHLKQKLSMFFCFCNLKIMNTVLKII